MTWLQDNSQELDNLHPDIDIRNYLYLVFQYGVLLLIRYFSPSSQRGEWPRSIQGVNLTHSAVRKTQRSMILNEYFADASKTQPLCITIYELILSEGT
jgi:hypothetical protein